jgi:malate dehydrogenase (oxaloacetate-decarboxylating)(NADP+)
VIPKPLDPRLLTAVAPAVARAAMDCGVARYAIDDWEEYEAELLSRVGIGQKLVSGVLHQARAAAKRVTFAEADEYNVLKAAQIVKEEGIATPVLLGPRKAIRSLIEAHRMYALTDAEILDPLREDSARNEFAAILYEKRKRKGVTLHDALRLMEDRNYFGIAMVESGRTDAFVSGQTKEYPKVIRPALHLVGTAPNVRRVAGMYVVNSARGAFFLADTTVNFEPSVDDLVDIIGLTARMVRFFDIEPRVAVLSYSNFGSTRTAESEKCSEAVRRAKRRFPALAIDGEVQANIAVNPVLLRENYPFSDLAERGANTLIFPNLAAGNIAYKLLSEIGGAEIIGPILMGMAKPVQVLQLGSTVREIVNMAALAVVEAQKGGPSVGREFGSL